MAATYKALEAELRALGDPARAESSKWFFKTGKGQYGEGDRFLGISVPVLRKTALRYMDLAFVHLEKLLESSWHEIRLAGLEILVAQYEKGSENVRNKVFEFYLAHTSRVNNWDLVDGSAPYIVGEHLRNRPRDVLYQLAESTNLWERRIAIVSTLSLIRSGDTEDALALAEKLFGDTHDLMHKAVGWMLREVGKVNEEVLRAFLSEHSGRMPRTTLRYAIERFPAPDRAAFLGKMATVEC